MIDKGTQKKKAEPPKDDPLLRSKRAIIDKIIGSEGQQLAEKRLAAVKQLVKWQVPQSRKIRKKILLPVVMNHRHPQH